MAIELITGTPGSGKTTFAVSQRIVSEAGRKITLDDETCLKMGLERGTIVERRIVCAGVRGLKVDHERLPHLLTGDATPAAEVAKWNAMQQERDPDTGKMIDSDTPVHQRLAGTPPVEVLAIVQNWWLWCKPGDLIVIDEAQFIAPRAALGRKPPFWIQCLEIHRHYGVDFLIITQHPGLIDSTIKHLVGLHRHVRSVMGSPVCMVYVWDHASNPERYQLANKTTFVRRAKHYRLFHSSVAHVKPPTSGRSILVVLPLLLVGIYFGVAKLKHRFTAPVPAAQASTLSAPAGSASAPLVSAQPGQTQRPTGWVDVPELQGCMAVGERCTCIGREGRPVRIAVAMCRISSSSFDGLVQWAPRKDQPAAMPALPASAPSSPASLLAKAS